MRPGIRRGFTAAEKTELWDRWQRGESLNAIGRAFGKPSSSIYFQLSPRGGIRPAPRRRSRLALSLIERETISRGLAADQSARSMARLRWPPSNRQSGPTFAFVPIASGLPAGADSAAPGVAGRETGRAPELRRRRGGSVGAEGESRGGRLGLPGRGRRPRLKPYAKCNFEFERTVGYREREMSV